MWIVPQTGNQGTGTESSRMCFGVGISEHWPSQVPHQIIIPTTFHLIQFKILYIVATF